MNHGITRRAMLFLVVGIHCGSAKHVWQSETSLSNTVYQKRETNGLSPGS